MSYPRRHPQAWSLSFHCFVVVLALAGVYGTALSATFRTHPIRSYRGEVYDFSPAISWLENAPSSECPYPQNSPQRATWEAQKQKSQLEALTWSRFLLRGSVRQHVPQGLIVDVPITNVVEDGSIRQGRSIHPTYSIRRGTKPVLLKNAPSEGVDLPVFAVPIGSILVDGTLCEAFDYGAPIGSMTASDSSQRFNSRAAFSPMNRPAGQSFYACEGLAVQAAEVRGSQWRFTYTLRVRNRGDVGRPRSMRIEFLDETGVLLRTSRTPMVAVEPGGLEVVTGTERIDSPAAERVGGYRILQE